MTENPFIEACITATLISGEKISTGVTRHQFLELIEDAYDLNGKPPVSPQRVVEIVNELVENWADYKTIDIVTVDRGSITVNTSAVAYVEGYAKIVEED